MQSLLYIKSISGPNHSGSGFGGRRWAVGGKGGVQIWGNGRDFSLLFCVFNCVDVVSWGELCICRE